MFPLGMVLSLKRRGNGILVLSPSILYRAGFSVVFVVALFISLFGTLFEGEPSPVIASNAVPLALVLLSGLALLYDDSWTFDTRRGTFTERHGILVAFRRRSRPLTDLRVIAVESFRKGRPGDGRGPVAENRPGRPRFSRIERLVARDAAGTVHVLDSARAVHGAALRRAGRGIAEHCGVPFRDES